MRNAYAVLLVPAILLASPSWAQDRAAVRIQQPMVIKPPMLPRQAPPPAAAPAPAVAKPVIVGPLWNPRSGALPQQQRPQQITPLDRPALSGVGRGEERQVPVGEGLARQLNGEIQQQTSTFQNQEAVRAGSQAKKDDDASGAAIRPISSAPPPAPAGADSPADAPKAEVPLQQHELSHTVQQESRRATSVGNVLNSKQDAENSSIGNIR
jgi:hypothetical protein